MLTETQPKTLRVFISSPGDVANERFLVRQLLRELPYDPFLRGNIAFDVISYDDPVAPTPLPANLTPQEAVNRFGPKPSECNIVIFILWSRLGTPLDPQVFSRIDGTQFMSGTEWEFEDAYNAEQRPTILVYRCSEEPKLGMQDPTWEEKKKQYDRLNGFFQRFSNLDNSVRSGFKTYRTSHELKRQLEIDLKYLLREHSFAHIQSAHPLPMPVWGGSPYPGLRSFRPEEAPIFFGRDSEVDSLISRLRNLEEHFLLVLGASGTGKSSLVHAGLLPRLAEGAIEGSEEWLTISFTPGALGPDPFMALAVALKEMPNEHQFSRPREVARELSRSPKRLGQILRNMSVRQSSRTFLIFIDQLEELFTIVSEEHRQDFSHLIRHALEANCIRIIGTARADFLSQFASDPILADLVQRPGATFPLGSPGPAALVDMVRRPADRAGLMIEDGMADEIVRSVGFDQGALPLVAFCLEELYRDRGLDHRLTLDGFTRLGGLRGAITRRTESLLGELRKSYENDFDMAVEQMFSSLAHVDAAGTENRRRASRADLMAMRTPIPELIEKLIDGRLLTAEDTGGHAVVMLAHEILLREWPALRDWLDRNRTRLQRVQRMMLSLSADDAHERQFAIQMLSEAAGGSDSVVPALANSLNDQDDRVRLAAVQALGRIGEGAVTAVPGLVEVSKRKWNYWTGMNWEEQAQKALVRIGPAAIPELLKIKGYDAFIADVLGDMGQPAAPHAIAYLINCLHSVSTPVQMAAARALGSVGAESSQVVDELIGCLNDSDEDVRRRIIDALARVGHLAASRLIELVDERLETAARSQPRDSLPIYAAEILGWIGPDAVEGIPSLLAILRIRSNRFRIAAIRALGHIRAADSEVVKAVVTTLGSADEEVRVASATALGQFGSVATPSLVNALGHRQMHVREGAARALGNMGRSASIAVNALTSLLDDPEPFVQAAAAQALGQIRTHASKFLPKLISFLASENEYVRGSAIIALGRLGGAAAIAVPSLTDALSDDDWTIRGAAAASLSRFGASAVGAVGVLLGLLDDPEEKVRAAAAAALGAIGPVTAEVVPALLATFFSSAPGFVRTAAEESLNHIKFASPELLPSFFSSEISYFDLRRQYQQTQVSPCKDLGECSESA
jgi:HEAT repeat protein